MFQKKTQHTPHQIKSRRLFVVFSLMFLGQPWTLGYTLKLEGAYINDFLITENFETEAGLAHSLNNHLELGMRVKYIDTQQDSISGLKNIEANAYTLAGSAKLRFLNPYTFFDFTLGGDFMGGSEVKPQVYLGFTTAFPLALIPMVNNIKLNPQLWYSYHKPSAAFLANHIFSRGWSLDVSGGVGKKMGYGINYTEEFLKSEDSILDTNFYQPVIGGVPSDTLKNNKIYIFYLYLYREITSWLTLSYAFSMTDARYDRWVVTHSEPIFSEEFPRRLIGTRQKYAQYPYPTNMNALSHLLGVNIKKNWSYAGFYLKTTIPVYSKRDIFDSPEYVDSFYQGSYYTQKNTGPLTLEAEIKTMLISVPNYFFKYEFFSLPYDEFSYFTTNEKSYSYHKFKIGLEKSF